MNKIITQAPPRFFTPCKPQDKLVRLDCFPSPLHSLGTSVLPSIFQAAVKMKEIIPFSQNPPLVLGAGKVVIARTKKALKQVTCQWIFLESYQFDTTNRCLCY